MHLQGTAAPLYHCTTVNRRSSRSLDFILCQQAEPTMEMYTVVSLLFSLLETDLVGIS
jgi:hypothetical protein